MPLVVERGFLGVSPLTRCILCVQNAYLAISLSAYFSLFWDIVPEKGIWFFPRKGI